MKVIKNIKIVLCFILITVISLVVFIPTTAEKTPGQRTDDFIVQRKNAPKSKILITGNKKKSLTYVETVNLGNRVYGMDKYAGSDGSEYSFSEKTGDLCMVFIPLSENEPAEKLTVSEIRKKAEAYLSGITDLTPYTFNSEYSLTCPDSYNIGYSRIIGGYRSADFLSVRMTPAGELVYFVAPDIGLFDNLKIPEFDKEANLECLDKMVKEHYGDRIIDSYELENEPMLDYDQTTGVFQLTYNISVKIKNDSAMQAENTEAVCLESFYAELYSFTIEPVTVNSIN